MTIRYRLFLLALDVALLTDWWGPYHRLSRPEYFATPEDLRARLTNEGPF